MATVQKTTRVRVWDVVEVERWKDSSGGRQGQPGLKKGKTYYKRAPSASRAVEG